MQQSQDRITKVAIR